MLLLLGAARRRPAEIRSKLIVSYKQSRIKRYGSDTTPVENGTDTNAEASDS